MNNGWFKHFAKMQKYSVLTPKKFLRRLSPLPDFQCILTVFISFFWIQRPLWVVSYCNGYQLTFSLRVVYKSLYYVRGCDHPGGGEMVIWNFKSAAWGTKKVVKWICTLRIKIEQVQPKSLISDSTLIWSNS